MNIRLIRFIFYLLHIDIVLIDCCCYKFFMGGIIPGETGVGVSILVVDVVRSGTEQDDNRLR